MKRIILGILMVVVITIAVGVNLLVGSEVGAQTSTPTPTPTPTGLALIVWDSSLPSAQPDALEVAGELRNFSWQITAQSIKSGTLSAFKNQVKEAWGEPGANNLPKLFFYAGHGILTVDRPGYVVQDEPAGTDHSMCQTLERPSPAYPAECDEGLPGNAYLRDETLTTVFSDYTGMKALIFDTCFAGGLFDGEADLKLLPNSLVMTACSSNEGARWFYFYSHGHYHGFFSFHLINGLKGAARYGDNTITFGELYAYAEGRVQFWNSLLGPFGQNPRSWPSSTDPIWTQALGSTTELTAMDDTLDPEQSGTACETCLGPDCPDSGGVGGIADLPEIVLEPLEAEKPAATNYALWAGIAAGAASSIIGFGTSFWYIRRRLIS